MSSNMYRHIAVLRFASALILSLSLGACSTVSSIKAGAGEKITDMKAGAIKTLDKISVKTKIGSNPRDPLEGFNRAMFSFNEGVDKAILKPVAETYQAVVPVFVQIAIGNFFGNVGDVWTAVNNLMQGDVTDGVTDIMRVAVNTTFGLGGLIDIASPSGLPKHREDFGLTLGKWGVKSGPYVMLPILGPSTVRDTLATPVDFKGDLVSYAAKPDIYYLSAVRVIDKRSLILDAGKLIEEAALDKYVFIRDAYLQRRAGQVNPEDE